MDFWSSQPRNSLTINKQVGADRRIGETKIDPQYHKYIEHTIEHGYVIIENAFTPAAVDEANAELRRLSATPVTAGPAAAGGRNEFEGLKTKRIYALLNKSRTFDAFALHPTVVALNDFFLDPNWLLSTLHSIAIQPGEDSQTLHHDDGAITVPRPHKPFGSAIMVALDAYTPTNGATVVVPGSHTWGATPMPTRAQAIPVTMPAGSLVYFVGTLWHGRGRNESAHERRALTVQYCQPWMRQLENQFLAVDWDRLDEMPARLVDALGYQVGAPFVGFVDGISPRKYVARKVEERRQQRREKGREGEEGGREGRANKL